MKYSEDGFREVYKKFCLFDMTDTFKKAMKGFPGVSEADSVLTYGYIDHEAGVTLEILCACIKGDEDEDIKLAKGNDEIRSFVRIKAVEDVEFIHIDERIGKRFEKKMKTLERYENGDVGLRDMTSLDHLRHEYNVDDVLVFLRGEGKLEMAWVRLEGITEMFYIGRLLKQPLNDYGYDEGDMVCFKVEDSHGLLKAFLDERSDENDFYAIDDMTDEESGEILDQMLYDHAVGLYHKDKTDENYRTMIAYLTTNQVIVPFLAVFGDEDAKKIQKIIDEEEPDIETLAERLDFVDKDMITLKPDILEKNEELAFFPCYTSKDALGKYEDCYTMIPMDFMDAVELALSYPKRKLDGIVVNAFSTPVEISMAELRKLKRSMR